MEKILKGQLESISAKDYRKAVAMLKKADKQQVLDAWNAWKNEWTGSVTADFITREQFYRLRNTNAAGLRRDRVTDRTLADFDARKKYVIKHWDGYAESIGNFFSSDFVDLKDVDFVASVMKYNIAGLAY